MVHTLTPLAPVTAAVPISTLSKKNAAAAHRIPSSGFQRIQASSHSNQPQDSRLVHRRTATFGLAGLVLGLNLGGNRSANAASRRPPPPPPEERKDPGVNALTAKVLASKKRKEALKESMAKLREKGKVITEPPQPTVITEPPQ